MMKHRKAKPVAPPQALFDAMDGEASSGASPASMVAEEEGPSLAEALAASDAVLHAAEAQVAEAAFAREEAAILGEGDAPAEEDVAGESDEGDQSDDEEEGADAVSEPSTDGGDTFPGVQDVAPQEPPQQPKNRTTMENVALVFLEDAMARRLAVAWPVCQGNEDEWFDAAGFTSKQHAEARRIGRALRLNGICRDGGITDPLALQYITAVIAKPLAGAKAKPAKKEK